MNRQQSHLLDDYYSPSTKPSSSSGSARSSAEAVLGPARPAAVAATHAATHAAAHSAARAAGWRRRGAAVAVVVVVLHRASGFGSVFGVSRRGVKCHRRLHCKSLSNSRPREAQPLTCPSPKTMLAVCLWCVV